MNKTVDEQLSALIDGELGELELRRLLQQLDEMGDTARAALYSRWDRHQRASAVLQNDQLSVTVPASSDFVQRVSAAVVDVDQQRAEEGHLPDTAVAERGEVQSGAPVWSKFAVAASVALAVIVTYQQGRINDQQLQLAQANAPVETVVATPSRALPATQYAGYGSAAQPQLTGQQVVKTDNYAGQALDAAEARRQLNRHFIQYVRAQNLTGDFERCEIHCAGDASLNLSP